MYLIHLPGCKLQAVLVLYAARRKKDTISLDIENSGVNLVKKKIYVEFEVKRTLSVLIKRIVLVGLFIGTSAIAVTFCGFQLYSMERPDCLKDNAIELCCACSILCR